MYAIKSYCVALTAVLLLAAAPARPELIHAESVTLYSATSPDEPISNASDGDIGNYWYTSAAAPDYFATKPNPMLWLDLGADKVLDGIAFWNYVAAGNSVRTFTLEFFTAGDPNPFGLTTFTALPGPADTPPESMSFSGNVTARYVEMTLTDNYYGYGYSGGDRVGFKEIQFSNVVPEPGTLTLLAAGLIGLLAYAWRKRR